MVRGSSPMAALLALEAMLSGSASEPPGMPDVRAQNPSFSAPKGPADNMPVGNGEVVANVWVDGARGGSLALLLGRSDAFSGDVQPMKLGRVRLLLEPNPFEELAGVRQSLDLLTGTVTVSGSGTEVRVWSDARGVGTEDSVFVEVLSEEPRRAQAFFDSWRTEVFQQPTSSTARGPCGDVTVRPDEYAVEADGEGNVLYRFNDHSSFRKTMADQMLGELAGEMPDPLLGRASGLLLRGEGFGRTNATHLAAGAAERQVLTVFTHTAAGCSGRWDFLKQLAGRAARGRAPSEVRKGHEEWWAAFWNRSWLVLSAAEGGGVPPEEAAAVTQAAYLNRYLAAIQSRGALPIHHNGGTLTWGWDGKSHENPDARGWGGGYWFQNIRHSLWYAPAAGDLDLMEPLFGMYRQQQRVLEERSRRWFGCNGSQFAETSYFFGAYEPVDYGCRRAGEPEPSNPYVRRHYEGGVELCAMMLQAYFHGGEEGLLQRHVLPWCESVLRFYDSRYPKRSDGRFFLQHAQGLETWLDCDNPAAEVSALHRISEGLLQLPAASVTPAQRAFFEHVARALPAIPMTKGKSGRPQVSPCEGGFPRKNLNRENAETYAIWPYEFFAVNRSGSNGDLAVGLETFANVRFGHGNVAWNYDGQDAAMLGLAKEAWQDVVQRVMHQGRTEGSQFPGYLAKDPSDGAPEVESNGIVAATLQKMLLQTEGRRILLFPALLKGLDLDFKLRVPGVGEAVPPAELRVLLRGGDLSVHVTPAERRADVVVLPLQQAAESPEKVLMV